MFTIFGIDLINGTFSLKETPATRIRWSTLSPCLQREKFPLGLNKLTKNHANNHVSSGCWLNLQETKRPFATVIQLHNYALVFAFTCCLCPLLNLKVTKKRKTNCRLENQFRTLQLTAKKRKTQSTTLCCSPVWTLLIASLSSAKIS